MDAVHERRQRSDTPGHHATAERQKCDAANQKRGAKGIQSHELTIDRPSLAMSPARFLAEAVKPLIDRFFARHLKGEFPDQSTFTPSASLGTTRKSQI